MFIAYIGRVFCLSLILYIYLKRALIFHRSEQFHVGCICFMNRIILCIYLNSFNTNVINLLIIICKCIMRIFKIISTMQSDMFSNLFNNMHILLNATRENMHNDVYYLELPWNIERFNDINWWWKPIISWYCCGYYLIFLTITILLGIEQLNIKYYHKFTIMMKRVLQFNIVIIASISG